MAETAVREQLDQLRDDLGAQEASADALPHDKADMVETKPKRSRRRKTVTTAKAKAMPVADVAPDVDEEVVPPTVIERLEQEAQRNPIVTAAAMLGLGLVLGRLLSR